MNLPSLEQVEVMRAEIRIVLDERKAAGQPLARGAIEDVVGEITDRYGFHLDPLFQNLSRQFFGSHGTRPKPRRHATRTPATPTAN